MMLIILYLNTRSGQMQLWMEGTKPTGDEWTRIGPINPEVTVEIGARIPDSAFR